MNVVQKDNRLRPLLAPESIAVIGASEQPTIGRVIPVSLDRLGYRGQIFPINPKYDLVFGRRCYPSLEDLPETPDAVAVCVGASRVLPTVEAAAARGVRACAIFDGGFSEAGEDGIVLQRRISDICREAGIALCGPNCMGVINPHHRSSIYIHEVMHTDGLAGNVGLISHSGSICIGLTSDVRRFGYSHVISSGNEAVLVMADYVDALVDDPDTKVIALFIETVRQPERFVAAIDRAADAGKPVVVLKVGHSTRAQHAIVSHTGSLAGSSRVLSEVLRAHRAIETFDMDEFTEVLAACQAERWPTGKNTFVVTASGGQAELILDVASRVGVDLPPLPAAERTEVERVVGHIAGDGNPLDAWGSGNYTTNLPHALRVLNDSPICDNIVVCTENHENQPLGPEPRILNTMKLLAEAAKASSKPHFSLNTRPGVGMTSVIKYLRDNGMNSLGGTRQGLGALDRLARWAALRPPLRPAVALQSKNIESTFRAGTPSINEYDSKKILQACGLPVTKEVLVETLDAARQAAGTIGYPVVLKGISDFVPHKTEYGLVITRIGNQAALDDAWKQLEARLGAARKKGPVAGVLVQEMIADGVEVFVGVKRDPEFGLAIAFGLGGTAIDLLQDVVLRILPLREGEAAAMVAESRANTVLKGIRGAPPADVGSLVDCIERFSDYAWADRDRIAEIDINPIKVLREGAGCRIVDALIVPIGASDVHG
jgi:acetate---CoA ligase (ADP-forming)